MSAKTMVESMCGGQFLCKNVNDVWDFLKKLSYKCDIIREPLVLHLRFQLVILHP